MKTIYNQETYSENSNEVIMDSQSFQNNKLDLEERPPTRTRLPTLTRKVVPKVTKTIKSKEIPLIGDDCKNRHNIWREMMYVSSKNDNESYADEDERREYRDFIKKVNNYNKKKLSEMVSLRKKSESGSKTKKYANRYLAEVISTRNLVNLILKRRGSEKNLRDVLNWVSTEFYDAIIPK